MAEYRFCVQLYGESRQKGFHQERAGCACTHIARAVPAPTSLRLASNGSARATSAPEPDLGRNKMQCMAKGAYRAVPAPTSLCLASNGSARATGAPEAGCARTHIRRDDCMMPLFSSEAGRIVSFARQALRNGCMREGHRNPLQGIGDGPPKKHRPHPLGSSERGLQKRHCDPYGGLPRQENVSEGTSAGPM